MVMGSCEICFGQRQDYHVLSPLPLFYSDDLAESKAHVTLNKWSMYSTHSLKIVIARFVHTAGAVLDKEITSTLSLRRSVLSATAAIFSLKCRLPRRQPPQVPGPNSENKARRLAMTAIRKCDIVKVDTRKSDLIQTELFFPKLFSY